MKIPPSSQKLRGSYYTPESIASYLCEWSIQSANRKILEPSCGDGVFLIAAWKRLLTFKEDGKKLKGKIIGVELDPTEGEKARFNLLKFKEKSFKVIISDFFDFAQKKIEKNDKFDVVIGNPPFIRNHNFPESQRQIAFEIMKEVGLKTSRLTNSWMPFLVACTILLKNPGRLGMVIPAELLQVGYAADLRKFLVDSYSRITMITFKNLLFQEAQQEVVLLLCEKNGNEKNGIRTLEIDDANCLQHIKSEDINYTELKPVDHTTEKWTQYFLSTDQIELMRNASSVKTLSKFGELAKVDVGVVTGMNSFFVVNEQFARKYNLEKYSTKIVPRSNLVKGVVFTANDWDQNRRDEKPVYLLNLNGYSFDDLPASVVEYIRIGEANKINDGYKCRKRPLWWAVPSIWIPDAFLLRQNNEYPKLIINDAKSTTTDTIHRVKVNSNINIHLLTASFYNSLTFAHAEIIGRSYGGGVLELEPSEAEKLMVPYVGSAELDLNYIDTLMREKAVIEILDYVDQKLLVDQCGFSKNDVMAFREIWLKLMGRRKSRKVRSMITGVIPNKEKQARGELIASS